MLLQNNSLTKDPVYIDIYWNDQKIKWLQLKASNDFSFQCLWIKSIYINWNNVLAASK